MNAIPGADIGLARSSVAVCDGDRLVQTFRLAGPKQRWFYCRKCALPESIGGVLLPEKSQTNTSIVLVLAVGDGCGKYHKLDKTQRKRQDMRPQVNFDVDINDQLIAQDDHPWGIVRSPYNKDEYFVHECVPIANLGPSEN